MVDVPVSGALSYVQYGIEESAYGTEASTINSAFGNGLTITPTRRNNIVQVYGLGSRDAQKLIATKFEGALEVNFVLGNAHWFPAFLGASSSGAVGSAYDHTYTAANTIPSITVENGINLGTTDSVVKFLGCKINEFNITAAVGDIIRVRLLMPYKTESEGTTLDGTPATDAEEPLTFAHASIDLPSGSTLVNIQSIELNGINSTEGVWGLGSRLLQKLVEKDRRINFRINGTFEVASALLEKFYGAGTGPIATSITETATLVLTCTNGLTAADERTQVYTLTGIKLDEESLPQDPAAVTFENVTGYGRTLGMVETDATETTIFD